jgi:hypothetical protein
MATTTTEAKAKRTQPHDLQNPKSGLIRFRVSTRDKMIMENKAAQVNKTLSAYLLDLGLHSSEADSLNAVQKQAEISETETHLRVIRYELQSIGVNVNQLAKKGNAINFLTMSEQKILGKYLDGLNELVNQLKRLK